MPRFWSKLGKAETIVDDNKLKYESKDIPSARDFIESLKKELINPLPIIYTLDWEEESYVMGAEEKMS